MLAKKLLATTKLNTAKPVLVVGGGLVGLSQALFLRWQGVPTILIDKHPGSSPHPRAIGYTPRTLELFRACGLGDSIEQAPPNFQLRRARIESLAGKWFEESHWTPEDPTKPKPVKIEYSACNGAALAQDRLEPILRNKALELGADIRLSTELLRFEETADGVTASLKNRLDGSEYKVEASFMVAADGHTSPIRQNLNIGRSGLGVMKSVRSVLFKAPLEKYLEKGVTQFTIDQGAFKAFMTTYNDGRWVLIFGDEQEHDDESIRKMVSSAIGDPSIEFEVLCKGNWELSALITDRFQSPQGRVFIAGDAAHTLPPTRGGYGANTGIDDAHNLAWKLAAVLRGTSGPDLLATYDAERRPVAWLRYKQMFARGDYRDSASEEEKKTPIIEDSAVEFGQLYRSAAVAHSAGEEASTLPDAQRPDQWLGQPGTRAPHMWVMTPSGQRISLLDVLQRDWVLLSTDAGAWKGAAEATAAKLGVPLRVVVADENIHPEVGGLEAFQHVLGISGTGATLVRPDGYIAWRSVVGAESAEARMEALTSALSAVSSAL